MKIIVFLQKHCLLLAFVALFGLIVQSNAYAEQTISAKYSEATDLSQQQTKTVVYYFHGNMRCSSCRKIEAYTKEAIQSGFAEALKNGRLELKVINVETPGNDHYVKDFQLYTRSVVVERRTGSQQDQWKNLDRVWRLFRNKTDFIDYVQRETRAMMKGA